MVITSLLRRALGWLRSGYPERAPGPERVPLLALLRPAPLTEDQLAEVVRRIKLDRGDAAGPPGDDEIAALVTAVTGREAGPENVRRVAERLAAEG